MAFYTLCVIWRVHTSSTAGNICWWPTSWSGDNLTNQTGSGGPDNCGVHEQLKYLAWFWTCPQLKPTSPKRSLRGPRSTLSVHVFCEVPCPFVGTLSPCLIFPHQLNVVHVHVVKATCKRLFHGTMPPSSGSIG